MENNITTEQLSEGNKLIAEFTGAKIVPFKIGNTNLPTWQDSFVEQLNGIDATPFHQYLGFHSSWDWLMPVVEKIAQYSFPDESDEYAVTRTFQAGPAPMVRIHRFALFQAATLIEATWLAVVEFIKWHNEQKEVVNDKP